jgi:hypothetical protein
MRVVTSDKSITSISASVLADFIKPFDVNSDATAAQKESTATNTMLHGLPALEDWDQIPHAEFVDSVNKGLVMPIWARTREEASESASYGYPAGYATVTMQCMPIWAMEALVFKSFQGTKMDSPVYTKMGNVLSDLESGEFPVRANIAHFVGNETPAKVCRHDYEMVGALVFSAPNCIPVTYCDKPDDDTPARQFVTVFGDIPTNWYSFMQKVRDRMSRSRSIVHDTYLANEARYIDTIIKPHFEENQNREGCLTQPYSFFKDGFYKRKILNLPRKGPPYNMGGMNFFIVQSPMTNPGSFSIYASSYYPVGSNSVYRIMNDYPDNIGTSYDVMPGARSGVDTTDPAMIKFLTLLSQPLDPWNSWGVNRSVDTDWFKIAGKPLLQFLDVYEYDDDINALGNNAISTYTDDGNGNVVDPNGDPVSALTGSVKDLVNPNISLGITGDHTMTHVWRQVIGDLEDALKSDVE